MKTIFAKLLRFACSLTILFLTACGGGTTAPPPATYSISGTVTGLQAGHSVTILYNGGSGKTVTANSAVTLATSLTTGTGYSVTIGTQPVGQTCKVVYGTGTVGTANITNVQVNCVTLFAYVANYGSNNVSAYTVDATTGALTLVSSTAPVPGSQPVFVTVDPSGKFAYVVNQGSNNVSAYTINASSGALTAVTGSPFAAGSSPDSVTVDPSGKFVYVTNSVSSNVSAYTIDANRGALTLLSRKPI